MKSEEEKQQEANERYRRYRNAKADYERRSTGWAAIVVFAIMVIIYLMIFH
jgi:hypothetical protein